MALNAEQMAAERERFNALSEDDAKALLSKHDGQEPVMRSCWYCNGAHERLKEADYAFVCMVGCGQWYIGGFPATIVGVRASGMPITDDVMAKWEFHTFGERVKEVALPTWKTHAFLDVDDRHPGLFGDAILLRDDDGMGFALGLSAYRGQHVRITIEVVATNQRRLWPVD